MSRSLPVTALALAFALGVGGCGGKEQPAGPSVPHGDFGPTEAGSGSRARPVAPPLSKPPAAVAQALSAGVVGVVGVEGDVGVRPRALEVSGDGTLEGLSWERWSDSSAVGRGRLRLRDCDPMCANGGTTVVGATVSLSHPRLCGRATYFDRAEVSLGGDSPPATYVRAPC